MSTRLSPRRLAFFLLVATGACVADSRAARAPSRDSAALAASVAATNATPSPVAVAAFVAQVVDSTSRRATPKLRLLTEAEQRVADGIVFAPSVSERFLVAARNKRLLVDVGRVDLDVKKDAALLPVVRRVSALVGPLAHATHVRVRGTWGTEVDSITGYDVWNGRAVAVLATGPATDSLLERSASLIGVATRASAADSGSTSAPSTGLSPVPAATPSSPTTPAKAIAAPPCVRDSMPAPLAARVVAVRDSLVRWVSDSLRPSYAAGTKLLVRGDTASGCFGAWRALVVVSTRTPAFDWNDERALLVASDGKPATSRLRDLRLRAHESLVAFDADGDGIDELATRGLAPRMGAQSVLKLDPATRRFLRYASGFAWETR